MTSLKSIMERRTMQVLNVHDMKSLKGGRDDSGGDVTSGGGNPPDYPDTSG